MKTYEDMVEFMEKVAKTANTAGLTVEERNHLSVSYKIEESRGKNDHVSILKDYRGKIETEFNKSYDCILNLLDSHLVPTASKGLKTMVVLRL
ncbi:hypothetical protein EUTSA_v10027400mg [Eutrema salsugineum]|uniref:14-3-3 domain-containing protein n=1 Tax=Eutrema salsugineum TaxID=72664 RepID=V4MRY6_EUTSA|nr:hypothetical protein EUTSA_v10027400mg [Eutrema salsugineum]